MEDTQTGIVAMRLRKNTEGLEMVEKGVELNCFWIFNELWFTSIFANLPIWSLNHECT